MEDGKITIGFNLIDEFGNEYRSESKEGLFDEDNLDFSGRQLNTFLSQCGYYRNNSLIFMESVNEEEYEAIADFLEDYRKSDTEECDEDSYQS